MRVLLVDDEASIRRVCTLVLRNVAQVTAVATATEALAELEKYHFQLALVDLYLADTSGETLLHELAERWPGMRRIAFTASPTALRDMSLVEQVLDKPFSNKALVQTVRSKGHRAR